MPKRILLSAVLPVAGAIFMAACLASKQRSDPTGESAATQEKDCAARGGKLFRAPHARGYFCFLQYADGGKDCTDRKQCQGGCYLDNQIARPNPAGSQAEGHCSYDSSPYGCKTEIVNGMAQQGLCGD
ncbi:MAG: hypothetical protein NTY77_16860 [Elusimicrobia bacterium]|nr:hypothetical protein [Elusimicrobiota bacterium]